jgi:hypothetical protein
MRSKRQNGKRKHQPRPGPALSKKPSSAKKAARLPIQADKSHHHRAHRMRKGAPPEHFMVAGLILSTHLFLTMQKHGLGQGLEVTALTWAFLVFLTPMPLAGVLIELPLKFFTNHSMIRIQMLVWALGLGITFAALAFFPQAFSSTSLLVLFLHVLTNPFPYWGLLGLCAMGTFISVYLVDDVVDEVKDELHHHHRKHMSSVQVIIAVAALALIIYTFWVSATTLGMISHIELF